MLTKVRLHSYLRADAPPYSVNHESSSSPNPPEQRASPFILSGTLQTPLPLPRSLLTASKTMDFGLSPLLDNPAMGL